MGTTVDQLNKLLGNTYIADMNDAVDGLSDMAVDLLHLSSHRGIAMSWELTNDSKYLKIKFSRTGSRSKASSNHLDQLNKLFENTYMEKSQHVSRALSSIVNDFFALASTIDTDYEALIWRANNHFDAEVAGHE